MISRTFRRQNKLSAFLIAGISAITLVASSARTADLPREFDLDDGAAAVLVEDTVSDTPARVERGQLVIPITKTKTLSIDAVPDTQEMKQALGLVLPDKVKAKILEQGGTIPNVDPMDAYRSMSPNQQEMFRKLRISFLKNAAFVLEHTRLAVGVGSVVGSAFAFAKAKAAATIARQAGPVSIKEDFQERTDRVILSTLKGIDFKLWSQAPLLLDSNEYGVGISLGIVATEGVYEKGLGGSEELGLSLAYNKNIKAMVFEIFHNSENFKNALLPLAMLGVPYKIGFGVYRRDMTKPAATIQGHTFYPPVVPGYSSVAPEYFGFGVNSAIAIPPSPFCDLMTYVNSSNRISVLRITVSPVMKGFVRIHIGDVKASVTLLAMRFVGMYKLASEKISELRRGRTCSQVLGHK